jgi:hypothetical protein
MHHTYHDPWLVPLSVVFFSWGTDINPRASTAPFLPSLRSFPALYHPRGKPNNYAALFTGGQHAAGLRTILADMGYPQPPTTILCNNTSAIGLANDTIKQKHSKAIDMRFHWIRDRIRQNQFGIVYIPTKENIADYMTKNLPKELHDRFTFYLVRDTTNNATQCLIAQSG